MDRVCLLTVEHTTWLKRPGVQMLILRPDFSVPPGWSTQGWRERTEPVSVVRHDGRELEATAQIRMTHLNSRDPEAPLGLIWRLTLWLTDRTAAEVPEGSRIFVSHEVKNAILPASVGEGDPAAGG